ncbi:MAG TPA: type II toxin-antitoxin system VapC family toxin [Phycisphaerales bacterium]|nr:type II toxin-antitoxin system VapC family toxin [Phycisphaerales bacterium]
MRYLLDTNVALYFLGGRPNEPLPDGECAVLVITELELLAYTALDDRADVLVRQFPQSVGIVELTDRVKAEAIRLRRSHDLKLPDAIVAGTAAASDVELLTNDARMLGVPGLRSRSVALRED